MSAGKIPLISIGVATYKRHEFLKETLSSILSQKFQDFEILVGNNDVEGPLTSELLGIQDERVRWINRPVNLGQLKNMNTLLEESRGRYFTWLNDDDLYAGNFLQEVYKILVGQNFPKCVFSAYESFSDSAEIKKQTTANVQLFSGRDFLEKYLRKNILVIGCYGIFDSTYLKSLNGMEELAEGPPIYSDSLLAMQAGTLSLVPFIGTPMVFFRIHPQSVSNSSRDLDLYYRKERALWILAKKLFAFPNLSGKRARYLFLLFRWFLDDAFSVALRAGGVSIWQIENYALFVGRAAIDLSPSIYAPLAIAISLKRALRLGWRVLKSNLRHLAIE